MTSRLILFALIVALVFAAAFADEFQLANIDDAKWEFARGSPNCPNDLKIDTEESAISAAVVEASMRGGALAGCTGAGSVDLVMFPTGGNGFQKGIAADKDSSNIWGGVQAGMITCGQLTFPNGTFWQFFSPEDDFVVNPSKTLGGTNALLAAESSNDVEFQEDRSYLVLGDLCMYKQESRAEGLVESAGDRVDDVDAFDFSGNENATSEDDGHSESLDDILSSYIYSCFPARATIETAGGVVKRMDDVQIGDEIKVGPGAFSRVFMFTHKSADTKSIFVRIVTDSGARVELTPGHYIYANDHLVAAATVKNGDRLRLSDGRDAIVLSVSTIQLAGLYNPQTVSGDIAVDGVVSSTYTTAVKPAFAHALLAPLRAFSRVFGFETTAF